MKMKKWMDIMLDILCVMYYFDFILHLFAIVVTYLLSAQDFYPIYVLIALIGIGAIVYLGGLLVKLIYMHIKKKNTEKESLKFKIMSLTCLMITAQSLFPLVLIGVLNTLTSYACTTFLFINRIEVFIISLIVYICIVCYLLKEYKDKKGATDKTGSDE